MTDHFSFSLKEAICGANRAFAAILKTGDVVTWGDPSAGGDCSEVGDQLRGVREVQATAASFAALKEDGSVITWGDPEKGGDSSLVRDHLRNVQHIQSTQGAFAAIREDGSVVTWGTITSTPKTLSWFPVQKIQSTYGAFAAILNGFVVAWGDADYGGLLPCSLEVGGVLCSEKVSEESYIAKSCGRHKHLFFYFTLFSARNIVELYILRYDILYTTMFCFVLNVEVVALNCNTPQHESNVAA